MTELEEFENAFGDVLEVGMDDEDDLFISFPLVASGNWAGTVSDYVLYFDIKNAKILIDKLQALIGEEE